MKNFLTITFTLLALFVARTAMLSSALAAEVETVRQWDEERVSFWINIYTMYDSTQSVVHDNLYPHIVYEVLQFSSSGENSLDKRQQIINQTEQKYQQILARLAQGSVSYHDMSADDWRVYNLLKPVNDPQKYDSAANADRIRVQDGRRDLFLAGIKRSGRYLGGIQTVLRTFNLPLQLTALIFVESLFYPKAVSKVGAAGPWQLMPDTARRYIHVGADIDERFDPFISTIAAAQILNENISKLEGSWPLALTAYNHGLGGMLKASKQHGTKNLEELIRTYKSGSFKFASKNFYAEYLAAFDAFNNAERYFGKFEVEAPMNYDRIRLPYTVMVSDIVKVAGLTVNEVEDLNPALTSRVISNELPIPEGYPLRVPVGKGTPAILALRENEPKSKSKKSPASKLYQATMLPVMLDDLQKDQHKSPQ
jgi:membrane-bound lytic murein transglycosylase D